MLKNIVQSAVLICIIIAMVVWAKSCDKEPDAKPVKVLLDSKADLGEYTMFDTRWEDKDVLVRNVREKNFHPLNGPNAWFAISIKDGNETILYHILDYGGYVSFENNKLIVAKREGGFVGTNYGWIKIGLDGKREDLKSIMIKYLPENTDSTYCVFRNGFLVELEKKYGSAKERAIMSYGDLIGIKHTIPDYTFGIYKVAGDSLVITNTAYDKLGEGTYYIPYPGEGTKAIIDLHMLADMLRNCKARGEYPDVLFEGDLLQ